VVSIYALYNNNIIAMNFGFTILMNLAPIILIILIFAWVYSKFGSVFKGLFSGLGYIFKGIYNGLSGVVKFLD
jgi:hypothetical protein